MGLAKMGRTHVSHLHGKIRKSLKLIQYVTKIGKIKGNGI